MFPPIDWIIISHTFTALVVLGGIYAFDKAIKSKIKEEINNPNTIKKLTELIRPSLLFDSKEIILSDNGGMNYIDSFNIEYEAGEEYMPKKITFNFKKHLPIPPLLESIDVSKFEIKEEKGAKYAWIFHLYPIMVNSEDGVFKFRIEIFN